MPCEQHDFEEGQFLAVFGSQVALPSFFSVEVEVAALVVVVVVVVFVVDLAGVCGVWARATPATSNMAVNKTLIFFIFISFNYFRIFPINATNLRKVFDLNDKKC